MIEIPSNVIYIGQTNSGKTHSFKYMFKKIANKFSSGILICPTANLNYDYSFMPVEYVYEEFNEEVIDNMIDIQNRKVKASMVKYGEKEYKNHVSNSFIIIDDSIGLIDFHHSIFDSLFSKSRHLFISVFVMIQHINALSPCMRLNSLYIGLTVICDNNIDTAYKLIPNFTNKKDLKTFLDKYCIDYNLIWVDKYDPYKKNKISIIKFPKDSPKFSLSFKSGVPLLTEL